jgi:ankyrin repeat protein
MNRIIILAILLLLAIGCAGTSRTIMGAAGSGDIEMIKTLRAEGKNVNEADSYGITPLISSISYKKVDTARYLIESGADLKAKDRIGVDALMTAVDYEQPEIINCLLDNGADIEARDAEGRTPLIHAICEVKNLDIVKLLINRGADIESRDPSGKTPLALAVWKANNISIAKLLIASGANIFAKDNQLEPVLSLALSVDNRMDFAIVLLDSGAKLFEAEEGKARIFFIANGFYSKDAVYVSIEKQLRYLSAGAALAFIDIDPGSHIINIPVSQNQSDINAEISVLAGEYDYFEISQNTSRKAAMTLGRFVTPFVASVLTTTGTTPFNITPMDEVAAKEKIHALFSAF